MIRRLVLIAIAFGFTISLAYAEKPPVFATDAGAIRGYDPVAYFTDGEPVRGKKAFTVKWKGADWYFATAAHRDLFKAAPDKYAPQYGGYCAYAVSKGYTASTDPAAWMIVKGKLYLNYSLGVRETWKEDIPGHIARADKNWPGVLAR
jgi:YHS domain-containing protein